MKTNKQTNKIDQRSPPNDPSLHRFKPYAVHSEGKTATRLNQIDLTRLYSCKCRKQIADVMPRVESTKVVI